jgi:hypothetical protein
MQYQVMTKAQDAIYQLFRIKHDRAGNLPPLPGIFSDMMTPIVGVAAFGLTPVGAVVRPAAACVGADDRSGCPSKSRAGGCLVA